MEAAELAASVESAVLAVPGRSEIIAVTVGALSPKVAESCHARIWKTGVAGKQGSQVIPAQDFSKHSTVYSGRSPNRSASPGQSEAAARGNTRNRSLRVSGPTVRIASDPHTTSAGVRS